MKKLVKQIGIALLCVVGAVLLALAALLIWLTAAEYRPAPVEPLAVNRSASRRPAPGDSLSILTLNTGYAGLDRSQDFFMDGGSRVMPYDKAEVERNLDGLQTILSEGAFDAAFLQEVDNGSKRSFQTKQVDFYAGSSTGTWTYAPNYRAPYVPFPLPTIGRVEAGLMTINSYGVSASVRVSLSDAYSWPIRLGQLKRCLLVDRVPMENGRELVLVNLHPEAYDDGEARKKQTQELTALLTAEYEMGNYCIAGGDWNQTLPGVDPEKYPVLPDTEWIPNAVDTEMLPPGWQFAADDSAPTCRLLNRPYTGDRTNTQFYVIDGFLLSPNVELESVQTLDCDFEFTDHNPVLLKARLKEE